MAILAGIAVVLLIAAVKLDELFVLLVEVIGRLGKLCRQVPRSCWLFSLINSTGERLAAESGVGGMGSIDIMDFSNVVASGLVIFTIAVRLVSIYANSMRKASGVYHGWPSRIVSILA
jgi:hypothetical protein